MCRFLDIGDGNVSTFFSVFAKVIGYSRYAHRQCITITLGINSRSKRSRQCPPAFTFDFLITGPRNLYEPLPRYRGHIQTNKITTKSDYRAEPNFIRSKQKKKFNIYQNEYRMFRSFVGLQVKMLKLNCDKLNFLITQ